jgi:YHS domain-containing protein
LSPNGNVSPQVGQAPMNSSVNGNFQPPAQQPPVQQPPFGAAPPQQQGYAPPQTVPPQQAAPPQPAAPAGPKFAMDGYCVVSLVEQLHLPVNQQQWRKGDPRWGAEHRGKLYLFAGPAEQQKFLANPDYYTPVLLGFDPVLFVEQAQLIEGRREHGFTHEGRIYMFTSEQNLQKFWNSRDMFISRIQQAMNAPPNQQRR